MKRVLVVWEDEISDWLNRLLFRRIETLAPGMDPREVRPRRHTVEGNGNFASFVATQWPRVRVKGMPREPGPIEHVVCLVDGDLLHKLLPSDVPAPYAA